MRLSKFALVLFEFFATIKILAENPHQKQMKYKLTKNEFDALGDDAKKEYILDGETAILKLEGDDAPTPEVIQKLKDKHKIAEDHRKNAETKLKEADDRAVKLQKDLNNAGGNKEEIQKIKDAHSKELEKIRDEREKEVTKMKADRDNLLISETAEKIANEYFTIPSLLTPQIAGRLSVEEVNGQPVVRVKNADGTPSVASLDDLKKEFVDNKEFSKIIKTNVGSGGGASHVPGSGGAATTKKLSEMTASEEAQFEREHPDEYAAAVEAEQNA